MSSFLGTVPQAVVVLQDIALTSPPTLIPRPVHKPLKIIEYLVTKSLDLWLGCAAHFMLSLEDPNVKLSAILEQVSESLVARTESPNGPERKPPLCLGYTPPV